MRVYLDHNATTPVRAEVRELEQRLAGEGLGNPSSLHRSGRRARQVIDEARQQAAAALGLPEDALVFTSGGTEANNLALLGVARAAQAPVRLVTSAIEHSSVLEAAAAAEREGHSWVRVGVDGEGRIDLGRLFDAARGARLVSVMGGNNEIGVCPPIGGIADELRQLPGPRPLLHCDAAQVVGRRELPWAQLDLATLSGHKFGAPCGVGALVVRPGTRVAPLLHGGGQEGGLRPGTEDPVRIAAFALALELACREREGFASRVHALACELWTTLVRSRSDLVLLGPALDLSGPQVDRLPGTLNILAPEVDGKVLVTRLDLEGLEISAGSACASGSLEASHVLLALGLDEQRARAGLRISLGRTTRAEDVHIAVDILRKTLGVARAR